MPTNVIIIAGMHRSGTSLTASWLESAGVYLGTELLPAQRDNPKGFFEDQRFQEFQQSVMAKRGYDYLPASWQQSSFSADEEVAARRLIGYFAGRDIWGWKDPRTTLFLDEWKRLLPEARYLFVFRPPHEVVFSLLRRAGPRVLKKSATLFRSWCVYNTAIERFLEEQPEKCVLVNIHGAIAEPQRFASAVHRRLALPREPNVEGRYEEGLLKFSALPAWADAYLRDRQSFAYQVYDRLQERADIAYVSHTSADVGAEFCAEMEELFLNVNEVWSKVVTTDRRSTAEDYAELKAQHDALLASRPVRWTRALKANPVVSASLDLILNPFDPRRRAFRRMELRDPQAAPDRNGYALRSEGSKRERIVIADDAEGLYATAASDLRGLAHVFYMGQQGVHSAVDYLPGHKIGIPERRPLDAREANRILSYVQEKGISDIVLHNASIGFSEVVALFRRHLSEVRLFSVWHAAPSQFAMPLVRSAFNSIWDAYRSGSVSAIGFVKAGMSSLCDDLPVGIVFNAPPKRGHLPAYDGRGTGIAFVPLRAIFRKNLYSNVLAASQSRHISRVLTTEPIEAVGPWPDESVEFLGGGEGLERTEVFLQMAASEIVLNVTLAECQPMVFLEALAIGAPCLIGPNSFEELNGHEYKQLAEVARPDVCSEVSGAIDRLLSVEGNELQGLMEDFYASVVKHSVESYARLLGR